MVAPDRDVALARCRCLYLGAAVPTQKAGGIDGLQEPLSQIYPNDLANLKGLDCWLSIYEDVILVEYSSGRESSWSISSMHLCAALRRIFTKGYRGERLQRFIALDSAVSDDCAPPIFSTVLRRVNGVKVLECHSFVCKSDTAAFALVHAATYAFQNHTQGLHSRGNHKYSDTKLYPVSKPEVFHQQQIPHASNSDAPFGNQYEYKTLYKPDRKSPVPAFSEGPIVAMLPGYMYRGPHKPLIVVPPPPPDSFIPLSKDELPASRSSSQERAIDCSRSYLTVSNHINHHVSRRELMTNEATRRRTRSAEVVARPLKQVPHRVSRVVSPPSHSEDLDEGCSLLDQHEEFFFRDPSKSERPMSKAFKNFDRQFGNEYAFSKSLHVEEKGSCDFGNLGASAYALNEVGIAASEPKEEEITALASDLYLLPERVTKATESPVVAGLERTLGYMP